MKDLNVRMSFTRAVNSNDAAPWRLAITDVDSGCQVLEVRLTDVEYAELHAQRDLNIAAQAELNTGVQIGKRHEVMHKTIRGIESGMSPEEMRTRARAELTMAEVAAGWEPSAYECSHYNFHRNKGKDGYDMSYGRYVDREPYVESAP